MSMLLAPVLALTLPLTAPKLAAYLSEHPDATLESLLEDLPAPMHESFVLMHRTRSLHQASPEAPRQILFGSDARFLAAASACAFLSQPGLPSSMRGASASRPWTPKRPAAPTTFLPLRDAKWLPPCWCKARTGRARFEAQVISE